MLSKTLFEQVIYNARNVGYNAHKNIMHGTRIDKSKIRILLNNLLHHVILLMALS